MNARKIIYFLACSILLNTGIQAQDIELHRGNKIKTIKAGTFVKIVQPAAGTVPCEKCSHNILSGKLISYQQDIVTLIVYEKKEVLVSDGKMVGFRETNYADDMQLANVEIPKSEILSITQSGKKKLKSMSTGTTIATVIGLLGLGHLASIPLAGENGDLLAVVGAAEVVGAIILGVSSSPKAFVTHINCPDKPKGSTEIWNWD